MTEMNDIHAVHGARGDRPRLNLRDLVEEQGVELIIVAEGYDITTVPDADRTGHSPHAQYANQQGIKVVVVPHGTNIEQPDKPTLYSVSHELSRAVSPPDANLETVLKNQNDTLVDWLSRVFA